MVGESKILTVSYGTFSCTLEGFDDPFSTMKAIAEYFRDLAAGDRFFGAEPPQPDADMLHRIAEQTVQTRVNAEVADNSLILRQEQATVAPAASPAPVQAPVQAPVEAPVAAPAAPGVAAPVAAPVAASAAAVQTDLTPSDEESSPAVTDLDDAADAQPEEIEVEDVEAVADPSEELSEHAGYGQRDTIAEKLQRIRAVVSRENAEDAEAASFFNEDEHADEFGTAGTTTDQDGGYDEDGFDTDTQTATPQSADFEDIGLADAGFEEQAGTIPQDGGMLASVMARAAASQEAEADEADEAVEEVAEDTSEEAVTEDTPTAEADAELEAEADADAEDSVSDETLQDALEAMEAEADADVAPATEAQALSASEIEDDSTVSADDEPEITDEQAEDSAISPRRPIMVEKISRADVEAAQSPDAAAGGLDESSSDLSAEAEAALMRELAEVEAEMQTASLDDETEEEDEASEEDALSADAQTDAEDTTEDDTTEDDVADVLAQAMASSQEDAAETLSDEEIEERAERKSRALSVENEDEALDRLMDATSSRLSDDGEGAVRRASIAHLKAAVAATKADDSIAQAAADEDEREMDQYRDDLARVVRPGRARRAEGEGTSRPAPLVLVSEQRINGEDTAPDAADAAAAADVRPRRVTAGNLALEEEFEEQVDGDPFEDADREGFSAYAARYSAIELPDLLEAAAAHYAYVEGSEDFTRPMLMRKISVITAEAEVSREDGLRAFGSLLRQGRIIKRGNGKFVISEKSQFTPEAREAGE